MLKDTDDLTKQSFVYKVIENEKLDEVRPDSVASGDTNPNGEDEDNMEFENPFNAIEGNDEVADRVSESRKAAKSIYAGADRKSLEQ